MADGNNDIFEIYNFGSSEDTLIFTNVEIEFSNPFAELETIQSTAYSDTEFTVENGYDED